LCNVYKYSLHAQQITKYKQLHKDTELRLAQSLGSSAGDSSLKVTKISLKLGLACGAGHTRNLMHAEYLTDNIPQFVHT